MKLFDEEIDVCSDSCASESVVEELADSELEQVGGGAFPFIQQ